jgi:glycosyltransferase involved in cell wall biosynthesis
MEEIAVGATVFNRAEKIADLLDSIGPETPISAVYLGDNGNTTERKEEIYSKEYPFELHVLDLQYDSGLGHSRRKIVERSDEPYLLVVDSDIEIPHEIGRLHTILRQRPELGGVGGVLIEDDRIRSDCYDLFERGSLLLRDLKEPKQVQEVAGLPLVEFDQIQNVAMYRRECLEDYCWDSAYTIGWEHTDFFVGHKKRTEWSFGVCPEVMFRHYPGGSSDYNAKRRSKERIRETKQYFLEKWSYEQVMNGQVTWLRTNGGLTAKRRLFEQYLKHVVVSLPTEFQVLLMNARDTVREIRGKPPS